MVIWVCFSTSTLNPFRNWVKNRMRESQGQFERFLLKIGPEANSDDLKSFLKSLGHSGHHIGDEASRQALKGFGGALVIRTVDEHLFSIH